jgi:hypothetical protein
MLEELRAAVNCFIARCNEWRCRYNEGIGMWIASIAAVVVLLLLWAIVVRRR